jgi:Mor family transcriptional regulator
MSKAELRSKGPELLLDLASHVAVQVAALCGVSPEKAEAVGLAVADQMSGHWGGQLLYFPKGMARKLSTRDMEIYTRFNGSNHADLAREYDVSLQHIYRIIKIVHAGEVAARQGGLFPDPDEAES